LLEAADLFIEARCPLLDEKELFAKQPFRLSLAAGRSSRAKARSLVADDLCSTRKVGTLDEKARRIERTNLCFDRVALGSK
jgi:hypothetical protein